jgi:hypothetical protein
MEFLADLWLPIVLSAVFVFVASSIIHMLTPWHKGEYVKLPGEEQILEAMRGQNVPPGHYMFPCAKSMKDSCSPEMIEKYNRGPVGIMTVMPNGPMNMGKSLTLWFLFSVLVSLFAAYVAQLALPYGTDYIMVFRITGAVAVVGYAIGGIPESIWKGLSWKIQIKHGIDGIIYGLVTAGVFGWLWPGAA